jgi:hypothetical protein
LPQPQQEEANVCAHVSVQKVRLMAKHWSHRCCVPRAAPVKLLQRPVTVTRHCPR